MTIQTDGQLDGRGYHNIPSFSSKSAEIKMLRLIWACIVCKLHMGLFGVLCIYLKLRSSH